MNPTVLRILMAICLIGSLAHAADRTWDGGGADDNWSTTANWDASVPDGTSDGATMDGSTRLAPALDANVSLNRLTFAATAGNFTIGGANTLTMGGTSPFIEVLGGTQTISAAFSVASDLTIYVASGASLTISDTTVTGSGSITTLGGGSITLSDNIAPTAPTWVLPASNGATTNDTTPTWTWAAGGGGSGTFRFQLDAGGWVVTTALTFTPSVALGGGTHTLDVQERDAVGNWSTSATRTVVIDSTLPAILTRGTRDLNSNGKIDAIHVTFSEAMSGSQVGTWTVAGYTVGTPTWQSTTVLRLPLTELSAYDSAATPAVRYTAGTVQDAAGNQLAVEAASSPASDGAAPVMVRAAGAAGSTALTLTFSEGVATSASGGSLIVADLAYVNVSGAGASSISAVTQGDATGGSATFTVNTSFVVGDFSSDTVAAASGAAIFDLVGNAMATTTSTISTGPSAPTFSAPAATSNDATPTWTWASGGGGAGTYRFKLDSSDLSSGTTSTTSTSFTPGAVLGDGGHTLYVQESDAFGTWSASGSRTVTIDATVPVIQSRVTRNLDANGQIDAIHITFNESMSNAQVGSWTAAGYTVGTPTWQSGTVLRLPLTELASPDTGALPVVRYVSGTVQDTAGNLLATEASGVAATDGAVPIIVSALGSATSVTVNFSEPVVTTAAGTGNLVAGDFTYTGTGTSVAGFADANGLDQAVTFSTSAAVTSGGDTVAAVASQIYDLAGNAMGTTASVIAAPITTKETVAAGDWNTPANWQGGTVPISTDNVVVKHAMTIAQNGTDYPFVQINTLVIDTGGSIAATNDVSVPDYYTIIYLLARQLEARATTTVTNVQLYDGGSALDTIIKVSAGCTLTLTNTLQGHFTQHVVKQGVGELVWDSPANAYFGGSYDKGTTRVEAGTLRLTKTGSRPDGYALSVFGGATLDLQQDFSTSSLSGQGTITRSTNGTTTFGVAGSSWSGQIQNGGASKLLAVTMSGVNTWSGSNTFTGGLTLGSGTLDISGTAAIADSCAVTVSGGTFTVNDPEAIGALSGAGSLVLNASLTVNQAAQVTTLSGGVSGAGGLVLAGSGAGRLTLSGSNSYGGGTVVKAGAALVASDNTNLGLSSGTLTLDGGTLRLGGNLNLSASLAGSTADGNAPTVVIPAAAADRPVVVTANDGSFDLDVYSLGLPAFSTAAGHDLTFTASASGGSVFVNVVSGTTVWAGELRSTGTPFDWFIKRGAGTLELSNGANSWSKSIVRPEEGVLRVSADGALGTVSLWVYTLAGATFELASNYSSAVENYVAGTMRVVTGAANWSGVTYAYPAVTPSNVPTFDVSSGATLNLSGAFTYSQPWEKTGAGTLILSSGSNVNAGLTASGIISGGTLSIARDDHLGNTANGLTLQSGGTLAVTGSFTSARAITLGSGGGVLSTPTGLTLTLSGTVAGSGGLTKSGPGTLILSGGNTFSGGSQVLAGVLQVANEGGMGAAASGVTLNGGTLRTTADISAVATRGLAVAAGGGTVDVATATTLTWAGALSGSGALDKIAAGTLVLSGSNASYSGVVAVQAGTVRATSANALGTAGAGTTVANGAALELSGSFTSSEPLQLAGAGLSSAGVLRSLSGTQVLSGAINLVQVANPATVSVAGALTASGVISGAGGLSKIGTGDMTLSGSNTFAGDLTITAGRLLVGADANLGNSTNGVQLDGGTLVATASITASGRTFRATANGGIIDVQSGGTTLVLPGLDTAVGQDITLAGAGTLQLDIVSGGSTISGGLASSGTAGLLKTGAGSLSLTGSNTGFTTTTTVSAGRLRLDGVMGGPVAVQSGAILGGTGSMGALSVASGGTVKPGDPVGQGPGVLTASSLSLATGTILDFDLGTANDLISVAGAATVASGVQLNVLSFPAPGSFADGGYPIINAGAAPTYAGGMTASLPNGYSLSAGTSRATIGVSGSSLLLTADSSLPVVAGITSASPDGTYFQGQSFDVTVQFSKPITPAGAVTVDLAVTNGGAPVTRSVVVSAGAYPATALSGSYTVLSGDITAPGEANADTVVLAGSITDAVGHAVSGTLTTAGTLSSNKNIIIDNFVPELQISTAVVGETQPAAVAMNTLEARYFDPASNLSPAILVLASDQETVDPAQLTYRILLEASQGEVQVLTSGTWASGTTKKVVTTIADAGTEVDTFTQADINAGNVRYQHQSISGGNDAILLNVTDGDGKTSALYLIRFAVSGNAVPVISGLPASLTYTEEATHSVWLPVTTVAAVTDNDSIFPDGRLSVTLTSPQSGDQVDLRPDAVGVSVSGTQISVGSLVVGTLTRTSATSLEVRFDDPTTAGPSEMAAIINALGYRTTSMAPDPSIARTIQLSITDGSVGQTPNLYVVPVLLELYNDPPVVTVGAPIITVPGLDRTFTVTVTDPEGEPVLDYVIAAPPSPQATRGSLVQSTPGTFTYSPYYPSDAAVGDPLLDNFALTVTDVAFSPGAADPLRRGTAGAATSTPATYSVHISDGGGLAPRFSAPMRMTVAATLPFSFQPQVETAAGAVLVWELVDVPAQLTTAFGLAPPSQASFDTVSGQLSWPDVPSPVDGSGYFRFGILVTDTNSQTATLLPVMLRVGPGGAG